MLRDVRHRHIKPRLVPFQLTTTSAPSATLNIGYGDYTVSRGGTAGAGNLTHRDGFSRAGLFFATQSTGQGYYAALNATSTDKNVFPYALLDHSGSAVDGSIEGFCFGWDSTDLSLAKLQRVAATNTAPRIIWGKVTGATGAVAIGKSDFSVTRSGTGTYTISFRKAFAFTPAIMITAIGTSTTVAVNSLHLNKNANSVVVLIYDESQSTVDADFYICAVGSDARSDAGKGRESLQNSQRNPRIIAGQIALASGTPSLSIGGTSGGIDFTNLTDTGTGDFSVTIAAPFAREPAIFLTTTTQRAQVHSYSNNTIRMLLKAANGNNSDTDGVTNILVIGSDTLDEF